MKIWCVGAKTCQKKKKRPGGGGGDRSMCGWERGTGPLQTSKEKGHPQKASLIGAIVLGGKKKGGKK